MMAEKTKKPKRIQFKMFGLVPYLFIRWDRQRVDNENLKIHGWSYIDISIHPTLCSIGHEEDWYDGPIHTYKLLFFEVMTMLGFQHDQKGRRDD